MINKIFKWPKLLISAVYDNISIAAKKANTTVKGYLGDDKNINHISLVVYDLLPLAFKIGFRHELFNNQFHKHFKSFRNKIYSYDEEVRNQSELMTTEEIVAKVGEIQTSQIEEEIKKPVRVRKAKIVKEQELLNSEENKPVVKKTVRKTKPKVDAIKTENTIEKATTKKTRARRTKVNEK
jgi:hypothetical protein